MEIEGRRTGPSSAVAELTSAAAEPKPKPEPVAQPRLWVRNVNDYPRHKLARDQDCTSYG